MRAFQRLQGQRGGKETVLLFGFRRRRGRFAEPRGGVYDDGVLAQEPRPLRLPVEPVFIFLIILIIIIIILLFIFLIFFIFVIFLFLIFPFFLRRGR